jgi:gliding motility-associated-like protein
VFGRILVFILAFMSQLIIYGQSKLSVSITNPTEIHLCIESDYVEIEVRNITTSTVSGIECLLELPNGLTYIAGSLNSTNATEKNITNLAKPVFSISDLGLAQSSVLKIRLNTSCSISSFLNNGGLAVIKTTTLYSGGSVAKNSSPLNIKQPSLQIISISNQLKTADLQEVFVRQITLKNSGTGKLSQFNLSRIYENGLELLGIDKGTTSVSGDTVFSLLDSALFTTLGNGNKYFDLNESITITDTVKVISCSNLSAKYSIFFGCNGEICEIKSSSANVSISTKNPKLVFTPSSNTTNCMSSGVAHKQSLTIYNSGNDTAKKVKLHIFQTTNNGFTTNVLSKIDTGSFKTQTSLNGSKSPLHPYQFSYTTNTGFYSCLGSNPIGETYFNIANIAPGDSVIVTWDMSTCCPTLCNNNYIYNQRWKFDASYNNQCDKPIVQNQTWGSYGKYQYLRIAKFGPTDILDGQSQQIEYTITQGYFMTPKASSQFQLELILSSGITHSRTGADLYFTHANGTSWYPSYFTKNGDTIVAYFNGVPSVTLNRSELLINIKGDCSNSNGNGNQSYQVNFKNNPDTSCATNCLIPIYCDSDVIRVHCATSCNAGLHFNGFESKRISFGLPDNNNDGKPDPTGSIDETKIKTNRIMYGDTLSSTFRAKVYNAGSTTNWYYGKATSKLDWGYYLSVAEVNVKIYRVGNLLFTCNNIGHTSSASGYSKTFTFDISYNNLINSGCALYSSFAYLNVDSIELEVKYVVDKNPGNAIRELNINNDFYLSTVANPSASQKFQCDTFSSKISLIGYYFTNYGKNTFTSTSCNTVAASQNFYLSVGNCCSNYAGGNIFPYEYRKWAKLKEIIYKKPEGFDVLNSRIIQYRTAGTGGYVSQRIDSINPTTSTKTQLNFLADSFYSNNGGPMDVSDDGFHGTFTAYLRPNCKAHQGLSDLEYGFVFEKLGALGTGLDTFFTTTQNDEINYLRPQINVTVQNNYVYAEKDTVSWNIRFSNSSTQSNANYLWLNGVNNGNAQIVDIVDLSTNTSLTKQNNIFILGDLNALAQKDLRILATYSQCSVDSVLLQYGFNCNGYPDSSQAYPCNSKKTKLYFEPINTRLETSIIDTIAEVDLCAEKAYTVTIRNTGSPKVFNTYLDILTRPGMLLSDTSWLFIDGRSDSIFIPAPTYIGSSTFRWNLSSADSTFNANGLNGVKSNNGYFMHLKFTIKTDCDFTSSTSFLVNSGGYLKCGDPVNSSFTVSDAFNIKGISKPYFAAVSLKINPLDVCNYEDSTFVSFINLGPDTTGLTDKVIISLPQGVTFDTTYVDNSHNAPIYPPTYELVNGENTYSWSIPNGITAGDSCVFKIKTLVNPQGIDCGIKQIFTQSVISQPVLCVEDSTYCNINVATSSILKSDTVEKNIFALQFLGANSTPNGNTDDVNLSYNISNSGSNKQANDTLLSSIFYDNNQNGIVDSGDIFIASDTITQALLNGSNINRYFSFSVLSNYTCNLLIQIGDSNCVCSQTTISIPTIQLKNAGNDTTACAGIPFAIGSSGNSSNTYTWNNSSFLSDDDSSLTQFTGENLTTNNLVVEMILTTNKGQCSSKDTVLLTIYPQMQLQLQDTMKLCIGDRIIIGDIVTGGVGRLKKYQWSPTDSVDRPTSVKTYVNPSTSTTYVITITDDEQCTLTDSTHVQVIKKPLAVIGLNDSCANTLFSFTNNSLYYGTSMDSIHWSIGSLAESTFENPSFLIDSAQFVDITLYTSNNIGCWDTTSTQLEVKPIPQTDFNFISGCEGDTTLITSSSTIGYGSLTSTWNIDGMSYNGDSISYILPYGQTSVIVNLTTTSDANCVSNKTDTITIFDKPDIGITINDVCFGDSASLAVINNAGTIDPIQNYNWSVGDGSNYSTSSFKHFYIDTGNYAIQLIVSNANGCSDTANSEIQIHQKPISTFIASNVCLGDTTKLTSSYTGSQPKIDEIYWNLGSGFVLGDSSTNKLHSNIGTFSAQQRIVSDFGCADTSSGTYKVFHVETPAIQVVGNCENKDIVLNALPQFADSVQSITWFLNSDSIVGNNITYNFPTSGSYTINQRVTTTEGCRSSKDFSIIIDPAPIADIGYDKICSDNEVDFVSTASNCEWDLGDGNNSNVCQFKHHYLTKGTYPIELIVTNLFGCKDTARENLIIDNIVIPDFSIRDACEDETQWVVHKSSNNGPQITKAEFDMGNGDVVNELDSFEYFYTTEGIYNVSLTITTQSGCSYDTSGQITIHPLPTSDFQITPETADIFTSDIQIKDESSGADSLLYTISDGSSFDIKDFSHTFKDSGRYWIEQWVSTNYGCLDSLTKDIYISFAFKLFIPNAFTPNDRGGNEEFKPVGIGLKSYEITIYNRWGELIFESEQLDHAWDGKDAFQGYYMYLIRAYDFEGRVHHYKGGVYLLE